jgi:uncharacterized protein (TIGR02118 family)
MIKFIGLLTRKDGMSVDDFQRYWREVHGPLMAKVPGIRRYIQSHALPETYEAANPPAYDGLAEAWFDSVEAYESARRSREWQAGAADAANFIGSSDTLLTREEAIVDGFAAPRERETMVKYVSFLTRKEGMSVEDFQRHWREVHAPLIVAELTKMRRYVQCHVLPETYTGVVAPPFDGVPMAWYATLEEGRPTRTPGSEGQRRVQSPMIADGANFMAARRLPSGHLPTMMAREVVITG